METLALFDFDGTLIRGDSIVPYLCRAHAQGDASLGDLMAAATGYFLFRLHLRTAEEAKTRALQFRRRLSPARRDALDGGFAREYLLPRLYPAGKECLLAHAQAGRRVALVSASPDNYMRYVAAALGVEVEVHQSPAARFLRTAPRAFDLILIDPPYDEDVDPILEFLEAGWAAPGAFVVVERSSRSAPPLLPGGWEPWEERRYGETTLWLSHAVS